MKDDDKGNLNDIHLTEVALAQAKHFLSQAMVGQGQRSREMFIFYLGMARGRLSRITSRINGADVPPLPEDEGAL